ncbi:unc-13-like protein [Thalictrum thalictroides]|uniref:Unc-13-like protein n=1 Tax=Thalictrum thalictroides TaxID=46969 RepID=A0A7J6WHI4_THATH|nr:unc-13-like protein [Thalictrum thalictroides]
MGIISIQSSITDLQSPFGELGNNLSDSELRETAYEIFVAACRSSGGGRPLTYIPISEKKINNERSPSFNSSNSLSNLSSSSPSSISPSLQRSLTSTAASKVKKALGMKSKNSPVKESSPSSRYRKPVTVGELMRIQMRVSESTDSRIRRALLRISAGQLGKRIESMVLPLELLQQFKSSEFLDQHEYDAWQMRNLKVLEAGILLHPHHPLDKSDTAPQRLRQIIKEAMARPLETGKNSDSMQILRTAVMSLSSRSFSGTVSDTCHWADGFPLNLRLYQMLLEACFDVNEETLVIEEVDELLELIKKTWVILGIDQMFHNLCFSWVLFLRFISTGQVDSDLLFAVDNQLAEVAKDAKATKDPMYSKILSSTLSSILGWAEKRLLAYHDTFQYDNISSMETVVSLGVSAAKILVEDISHEYRRKRKEEVDVARNRIDTYIRSSIRTAFAQRMEKADSSRRALRNQANPLPLLAILANDISELANNEKDVFSPILKRWHPLAAGVAVATLHACYGNELKQFISGITELTPDAIQILRAADKLETDLVQIAVEDSVDSEDGGKAIIREMPPYEAETAISNLVKVWIRTRVDILKEWVDRNLQLEAWSPRANKENFAPSVVEVLRIIDETLDAFFQLPIMMHPTLLPDFMAGLDKCLLHYVSKTKSGCGSRNAFLPTMPALTRCNMGSKFGWKKKEKLQVSQRKKSQVGTVNGDNTFGIPQLCVRINTLQHIRSKLEVLERRLITYLRNAESATADDIANGSGKKFELCPAACVEGVQQLSEAVAYKVIFHDLSHVLWDGLYVGDPASTRIEPMLKELEQKLEMIAETVHSRVRTRVITDIMKASFDGFLLVLLAGGPHRSFTKQDSQLIEEDFTCLKDLYWSNGDGLPDDLIDKCSKTVREVLPLFRTDTESLIDRFRHVTLETYGPSAKSRLPLPATSGHWSPIEPNTLLRVLCYRHDEAATKFLKKTYNLPKKL